jgi:hypothetical protein
VWPRLTCLFGLPVEENPDSLMVAALGPVLRAAFEDIVEAPLPPQISRLLNELKRREGPRPSRVRRDCPRHNPTPHPPPSKAAQPVRTFQNP